MRRREARGEEGSKRRGGKQEEEGGQEGEHKGKGCLDIEGPETVAMQGGEGCLAVEGPETAAIEEAVRQKGRSKRGR